MRYPGECSGMRFYGHFHEICYIGDQFFDLLNMVHSDGFS